MLGGFTIEDEVPLGLAREPLRGTMNRYRRMPNFMGTQYQDVLMFTIQMVKDPCGVAYDFENAYHWMDYYEALLLVAKEGTSTYASLKELIREYQAAYTIYTVLTSRPNETVTMAELQERADDVQRLEYYLDNAIAGGVSTERAADVQRILLKMRRPMSQQDYIFTEDQLDEITSWLTGPNYPTLFHMYDYEPDVYSKYDYYAICSDVQAQSIGGDIFGLTATFITNSPYAWTEKQTEVYNSNATAQTSTLNIRSSEYESATYPIIKITPKLSATTDANGRVSVSIKNARDNKEMTVSVLKQDANEDLVTTTIDCQKAMITDNATNGLISFDDLGISDVGDIYWFKLYNGDNNITYKGQASIRIEYRLPRKVGVY